MQYVCKLIILAPSRWDLLQIKTIKKKKFKATGWILCPSNNTSWAQKRLQSAFNSILWQGLRPLTTCALVPGELYPAVPSLPELSDLEDLRRADSHSLTKRNKSNQASVLGCAQSAERSERTLWCCSHHGASRTLAGTKDTQWWNSSDVRLWDRAGWYKTPWWLWGWWWPRLTVSWHKS